MSDLTVDALKEYVDSLIAADQRATALAHDNLAARLEGFPQQFATKGEMDAARDALQRLERDSISREVYESNHKRLTDMVTKLDREKLSEAVFQTFVDNQRRRDEEAAIERRAVAAGLAARSSERTGYAASWRQIVTAVTVVTAVLTVVVLYANHMLG